MRTELDCPGGGRADCGGRCDWVGCQNGEMQSSDDRALALSDPRGACADAQARLPVPRAGARIVVVDTIALVARIARCRRRTTGLWSCRTRARRVRGRTGKIACATGGRARLMWLVVRFRWLPELRFALVGRPGFGPVGLPRVRRARTHRQDCLCHGRARRGVRRMGFRRRWGRRCWGWGRRVRASRR